VRRQPVEVDAETHGRHPYCAVFGLPENPAAVRRASASEQIAVEHDDARIAQIADPLRRIAFDEHQVRHLANLD
jgi:hypothetical protein